MESPWRLKGHEAQLALPGVEATIDLAAPSCGLSRLAVLGQDLHGSVLGAHHADVEPHAGGAVIESYERGEDLVAVYDQTEACPFRTTFYWRAGGALAEKPGVTLDMILSVQTNLLDVTPRIETRSCFSDAEVVLFPPSDDKSRLDLDRGTLLAEAPPDAEIGCVMLRLAELDATYCELIHPSDWRGLSIRRDGDQIEWSWSLVGHFMEKGVIRRLRVRGAFLNGRAKEKRVGELYADFAESPPPLTT